MVSVCQKMTMASTSTPAAMTVSPMAGRSRAAPPPPPKLPVMSRQPELFEDAFDARGLGVEERLVVVAEQRDLGPFPRLAGVRPLRRRGHLLHQRDHRLARRVVHARRREHAAPVEQLDVDALLFQSRRRDASCRLSDEIAITRSLPALICSANSP